MSSSGQLKSPIIYLKRLDSAENLPINLQSIAKVMQNYLISISTHSYDFDNLKKKQSLKQLIQTYSELIIQLRQQTNIPNDSYLNYVKYYKQCIKQKQEKIKGLNQEIVCLMKTLSHREQEISQNQTQVFKLKLQLEQKQKAILQLMMKNKTVKKDQLHKNNQNSRKPQIKIKVNEPIRKEPGRDQSVFLESQQTKQRKQNAKEWAQERKNLLKVLKQKDLKIYQLIQQLNERNHNA